MPELRLDERLFSRLWRKYQLLGYPFTVRLILSRKGFDSTAGGVASPIFDDGTMASLPIPGKHSPIRYEEIRAGGRSLAKVVPELTNGKVAASSPAHLDPDLVSDALRSRMSGWQPLFGQANAAQSVLTKAGVGVGDVFLFYGWFRRVEQASGRFRYVKQAPDLHVLFGWLQVGEVIDVARSESSRVPAWAAYHPHFNDNAHMKRTYRVTSRRSSSR